MMRSLTREEAKALGRRAQQPTRAPGELLAIWCSGNLVNTKNARLHHMAEYRYKRGWNERVALALLEAGWKPTPLPALVPGLPKRVEFLCHVRNRMDSQDGLRVACAPILDALGQYGVLTGQLERPGRGDEDARGHEVVYGQVIDRARRGVEIRISLREADDRRGR